ncbi:hypothetical protein pD_gene0074 [Vibrio phage 033B]|nr:hypothetical protein pD_gene0074 [Vibrio phage 033B]
MAIRYHKKRWGSYRQLLAYLARRRRLNRLPVMPPPVIEVDLPASQTLNEFTDPLTLSITASGEDLTYRWQINYDGAPEAPEGWLWVDERGWSGEPDGLGTDTLHFEDVSRIQDGLWRCVVSNPGGKAVSGECNVDVVIDPEVRAFIRAGTQPNGNRIGWNKLDGIDGQVAYGQAFQLDGSEITSHISFSDTITTENNSIRVRCGDNGLERNGDYVDLVVRGYSDDPLRLTWSESNSRYQANDQAICDWVSQRYRISPFFFGFLDYEVIPVGYNLTVHKFGNNNIGYQGGNGGPIVPVNWEYSSPTEEVQELLWTAGGTGTFMSTGSSQWLGADMITISLYSDSGDLQGEQYTWDSRGFYTKDSSTLDMYNYLNAREAGVVRMEVNPV